MPARHLPAPGRSAPGSSRSGGAGCRARRGPTPRARRSAASARRRAKPSAPRPACYAYPMFLRHFLTIALALAVLGSGAAQAAPKKPTPDDALLAAHDAFRAGDAFKLAKQAVLLEGHLLEPYLDYWRLKLRLEDAPPQEVIAFLTRHGGSYLAERLRGEWLKELGRRGEWTAFDLELAPLERDDLEIRCYAWSSRLARADDGAFEEARSMWREPKELPAGCTGLAETMMTAGRLDSGHVWERVQLLLDHGQLAAAKRALGYLPKGDAPDERLLQQAASAPQRGLAT